MRDETKHPWIKGELRIARSILDSVFEEARVAYSKDEESCGVLVGPAADGSLVDGIIPMENRANKLHKLDPESHPRTAREYFDIDPLKFQKHIDAGDANGRPVKVLYHSHLDVGAYFSPTDADAAKMGGDAPAFDLAYLVTSVRKGVVDDHVLFVWNPHEHTFDKTSLEVV